MKLPGGLMLGGGKGGTCVFAIELGFRAATSLEFEANLHKIAQKNVAVLRLEEKVTLIHRDAFAYQDFNKHSHIFLFNPINGEMVNFLVPRYFQWERGA